MGLPALSISEIRKITRLRETGHSLNEIKAIVNRGQGTVYRYIKNVSILPRYQEEWKIKRGGSKFKSLKEWEAAKLRARSILDTFGFKEKMIILACLYWGEGNKQELNIINSDPLLIRVVLVCFRELGIKNAEVKIGLR